MLIFALAYCTEVRFACFFSGVFTTMAVINPPERKLVKRTSVHCLYCISQDLLALVKASKDKVDSKVELG